MKNGLKTFATTLAFMTASLGVNDNKVIAQSPGGFTPEAPAKTEVLADSAVKPKTNAPDTAGKSANVKAIIATENGECVAIVVYRGSLDADKTYGYIDSFVKMKVLPDVKAPIKVFIEDVKDAEGGTVFSWYAGGHVWGYLLSAKELHALQSEIKKAYVELLPARSSTNLLSSEP